MSLETGVSVSTALEYLAALPDDSVDLILTDPPYFRVKPLGWDNAWGSADGFISWLRDVAVEWRRVLKPSGTLICFAGVNPSKTRGASNAALVEVMLGDVFNVIASCVWVKADASGNGVHMRVNRESCRSWFPQSERSIVCEHHSHVATPHEEACAALWSDVSKPIRDYLNGIRVAAGFTVADCDRALGTNGMAGHYFGASQWDIPTRERYAALMDAFRGAREYDDLRREYDDLRREYDDLRRPFYANAGAHFTDVWTYRTVPGYAGKHPCEKPADMARDLVLQCSRKGDVVLDTFAGSGVFLVEAHHSGRIAIGCDMQPKWADRANRAIASEAPRDQMGLFE